MRLFGFRVNGQDSGPCRGRAQRFGENDEYFTDRQDERHVVPTRQHEGQEFLFHHAPVPDEGANGTRQVIVAPQGALQILQPRQTIRDGHKLARRFVVTANDTADQK